MGSTVHKATIELSALNENSEAIVEMPAFCEILTIADQYNSGRSVSVWYRCSSEAPNVRRRIHVVGTGYPAPTKVPAPYIASVSMYNGTLMLHFFDGGQV